jgi:molybdopterin-containing oxidoreductase family membrane subunit
LHRDFLPGSWGYFKPTWVDMLTLAGSFGLFLSLFLLFVRFLPMMSMAEVKGMMAATREHPVRSYDEHAAVHFGDMRG